MNKYKIINIVLLGLVILMYVVVKFYWIYKCSGISCSEYLLSAWLEPLRSGTLGLSQSLAVLLLFPSRVFKYWLFFIFSWVFPFSIYLIAQIDIHSSSMLSTTRGEFAWLLSFLLFVITTVYIVGKYLYDYHKKTIQTSDFIRLLILIPLALVVYLYSPFG